MIIGLQGNRGVGKDTVARILQYLTLQSENSVFAADFEGFMAHNKNRPFNYNDTCSLRVGKFSQILKETVCSFTGLTLEEIEDREVKESPLGEEWRVWYAKSTYSHKKNSRVGDKNYSKKSEAEFYCSLYPEIPMGVDSFVYTPRKLLEDIGTGALRTMIPNIHIIGTFNRWSSDVVFSDVRFPNEVDEIRRRGGVVWRVSKESQQVISEVDKVLGNKEDDYFDAVIENNGSILELLKKVRCLY